MLPVESYRSDRILFVDNSIIYSDKNNRLLKVNQLGQITGKYEMKGYELHHDFQYDEKSNKIISLVSDKKAETSEDIIVTIDMKNGKVEELIHFKELLSETYKAGVKPDKKEKYDWIHFNSLQVIGENQLLLSSRETSTIIMVQDIYTTPIIKYMLTSLSIWEGSAYEGLLYKKVGNFTANASQHAVTYLEDPSLSEGQYYVYMYNNNFAYSGTAYEFGEYDLTGTAVRLYSTLDKLYTYRAFKYDFSNFSFYYLIEQK